MHCLCNFPYGSLVYLNHNEKSVVFKKNYSNLMSVLLMNKEDVWYNFLGAKEVHNIGWQGFCYKAHPSLYYAQTGTWQCTHWNYTCVMNIHVLLLYPSLYYTGELGSVYIRNTH